MDEISLIKGLFGCGRKIKVIELGSAAILSNTLLSVAGASAFIDECRQLYSKESQERYLGHSFGRSVEKQHVVDLLNVDTADMICGSYQLHDITTKSLAHGWIGVKKDGKSFIYHISIYEYGSRDQQDNRKFNLKMIAEACLKILYYHFVDSKAIPTDVWIDYADTDVIYEILGKSKYTDAFYGLKPTSEFFRFEDFTRNTGGLILMRGSFNPPHAGHLELLNRTRLKYPNYNAAFLVSLNRRDKPLLTADECKEKLELLQAYNESVIFSSFAYFLETIESIRMRWSIPLIFPVGIDTINRFIDDCEANGTVISETGFKFVVFDRQGSTLHPQFDKYRQYIEIDTTYADDGISSTKIRNHEWAS